MDKYRFLERSFISLGSPVKEGRGGGSMSMEKEMPGEEMLKLLRQGDESVLGHIYSQYIHDLYRFGSQISPDKEMVKDCIQDVFITLIRHSILLKKIRSLKSYLYKSLYRAIIEKLRSERKYFTGYPLRERPGGFDVEISGESRMINEETYRLRVAAVNAQLKQLSKKQKTAILLYYYDGFTHEEIAEIMNLKNKNSVTKLVRRGLDTIRKGLLSILIFIAFL